MKRKRPARKRPVAPSDILVPAKRSLGADRAKPVVRKCVICGDEVAPSSTEDLCWVCRHLKISAWGESDVHLSAQE